MAARANLNRVRPLAAEKVVSQCNFKHKPVKTCMWRISSRVS